MANAHKHKQRVVRGIDDQLTEDFDDAARRAGSDRSTITRQLWEWFAGRPDAQLPERPEAAADQS
jgi:metal-responsive CopG/Arc/MetJ family transcriptional regulator